MRVTIQARFQDDFEAMALDLLNDAIAVEDVGDFTFIESIIDDTAEHVSTRVTMATDSMSWQGFEFGRVEAMDQQGWKFKWELDFGADHCETCLVYAAGGPYTIETLPGIPGEAPTLCNGSCRCNIVPVKP